MYVDPVHLVLSLLVYDGIHYDALAYRDDGQLVSRFSIEDPSIAAGFKALAKTRHDVLDAV